MTAKKRTTKKTPRGVDDCAHEQKGSTMSEDESILTFSEDISDAEAPDPLPAGSYPASVHSVEVKVSGNSGNRYLDLGVRIAPDDFPADFPPENAPDGAIIHYRRCVVEDTPRHRYNVRKLCEACGVAASKEINVNEFLGAPITVRIEHDTYQGVTRENIVSIDSA